MLNQEKPQDFELIELLIREVGLNVGANPSTSTQRGSNFESFKTRFQSYIDQIPSYLHSVGKEGFFPHFFLGSFSTLADTEIAKKLNIEKIYFSFDSSKTLKVAVIKKGEIKSPEDAADKVKLFVIAESDSTRKKFSYGELDKVLGNTKVASNNLIRQARDGDKLGIQLVEITKEKDTNGKTTGISVDVRSNKLDKDTSITHEFKEIKRGLWNNPEIDIAELTNSDEKKVKKSFDKVLKKVGGIHSKYKDSLIYAKEAREAAHHGFVAGALVNFRYRYNLRVYLEQFAGRGYADIVLVPRGKDRSLNAVPIIIELKAGTVVGTTPGDALEQAKDYAKGFQPNTMRVLTVSDNVLCVGLNLDSIESEKFSIYISPPREREPAPPTMQALLKEASDWNGRQDTITNVKEKIKQPLERIYHTFPGTPEKGGNYFSRFLLGQLLLANKFKRINLERSVFLYNEYPLAASTRSGAQSIERPVTTFMLTKGNQGQNKEVFIFHIREGGKGEFSEKKIPIDLSVVSKITEVCISLQEERKSDFFNVEKIDRYNSLNEYKGGKESFNGEWKNIPYPAELKETFDAVLESQLASSQDQSQSIGKYKELFGKLGEAMLPFKVLIEREAHTQAVFHGAFSHYSDIKLGKSQENRALVLTEFQTGRGKRIDMVVHGIKFADQASSAKEYDPVGLELKGPREGKTADALKDEANKQISDEYTKGVTYKTLTDGKEVDFIGVVFDKGASNADSLILMSKDEFASVKVVHSSIFSFSQQQPKNKFNPNLCVQQSSRSKRSINNCLFSKDDVEKFSKENIDENNVDKIEIDSEKFLTYIKSSKDEGKNAQLIEFVGDKSIEGDHKYLLDKVIEDQGYERYIQNERIKDLHGDIVHQDSSLTKNPKLKSKLMNAAGGIQLIRGIHEAIVSCKDGTATDCGLNLGGIGWSFASQPIENVMVKITPKVLASAEKVVGKIIPGVLGKQTKFAIRIVGVKFGSAVARGTAGALAGVFDIVEIGMSASNLVDCKKREDSDNPCGEKEIRDNIASISFSGVSFVSGVALTAASMPVVGIAVGFGLMVGYGIYSGVSNIVEYKEKYDTTHGENWSIFWRTLLFQPMSADVQHLAARKDTVNSLAKQVWKALNNGPNSTIAYGIGLGKVSGNTLSPDYAKILMNKAERANTRSLSRVIPDDIKGANRICLPQITNQDYEKGIKSSVKSAVYYCENAMVINHGGRVNMEQKDKTIVYDLQNVDRGTIVGSNVWNNNFLIYSGTAGITGGNNVANRFVLVNNPSFSGKIIGGNNSTNILDLSQLKDTVIRVNVDYRFKPSVSGSLKARVNGCWLINDQIDNNGIFNYYYVGRKNKVDEILCMGYSEHFTGIDNRDVIIDSGGGSNNNEKDVVENCKKVIILPYTTVKGEKSSYTFYVKTADYKGRDLYSEIDVDGTGTIIFPEIDLLGDCDQITYSTSSNTLSLKINLGQNNKFTLDIRNYVEKSSNKPHFVLIDKNGSNIISKIERSDLSTMEIKSFELHSEHPLNNFSDVENHYKKILNNHKSYKVFGVIRDKVQNQDNSTAPHMFFGSSEDDIINFDQGTMVAKGGDGSDMYIIDGNVGKREIIIDNNSNDKELDTIFIQEAPREFWMQKCNLRLNYNGTNIQIENYLQNDSYRHLIVMNNKGETFIPYMPSMSCISSSMENGKLVPFLQATQTQNMFLLPKNFQGDRVVIDSRLEDIEKYKDKDDLLLIREGENPFMIRIEGFYTDQSKWEDISYSLWNNDHLSPSPRLLENVDNVIEYKNKLRGDYERIVKEYVIDFTQSISIAHNQNDTLSSVEEDEKRIGVMVLKNITPDQVEVSGSGEDLIFRDKKSNYTINIKNWDNSESYRISTLEFDLGLEPIVIRRLDRFNLSEARKIQALIDKASENYQNRSKYTPKVENDFKCLISVDDFERENKEPTHQCLGFSSLQDRVSFTENFCSLEQIEELKNKTPSSNQILTLLEKLENNLLLNGYDSNIIDQCNKWMINSGLGVLKPLVSTAVYEGKWDEVKTLLDKTAKKSTADVEHKSQCSQKWTPLHYAVYNGNVELSESVFKSFLEKKGDINALTSCNDDNWSLLHYAVHYGNLDMVGFLIDKGANIEIRSKEGKTPLYLAVEEGKQNIINLLLNRGADIEAKNNDGKTPLYLAAYNNDSDIIELLCNRIKTKSNDAFKMIKQVEFLKKEVVNQANIPSNAKRSVGFCISSLRGSIKSAAKKVLKDGMLHNHSASTIQLLDEVYNFDEKLFDGAIKEAVSDVYWQVDKKEILRFIYSHNNPGQSISGYIAVFDKMPKNDGAVFELARCIKNTVDSNKYSSVRSEKRSALERLKSKLPESVRNAVFSSAVCIKNIEYNEYLYASDFKFTDNRRRVFTWIPGSKDGQSVWKIGPDGDNFYIRSVKYNQYLYAADYKPFDDERRRVFTWDTGERVKQDVWKIEPDGNNVYIKDIEHQEYLYAASNGFNYNKSRRQVFTWRSGESVTNGVWKIENCGSTMKKREVINQSVDIKARDNNGETSLHTAIQYNNAFNANAGFHSDIVRVPRQAKSNSEVSVYYIKGVEDGRRVQINLASSVKATGKFQSVANKIVLNREAISHLNKVRRVSSILMHGMRAKSALASFLNGDYQGVAINLGFITSSQGFSKVAEVASIKGLKLASEGKLLLSRSLKAASPFLARGTSAFVVYDLVNQVKAFKNGTEEALAGVVGDSIYLSVDAAEIGIEVAEVFEVLEGVSSVTGPVGTAIGAVVFIGTDIYMSVKRVGKIDEIVHLTGREKFIEGLRAFIGMEPEQYIGELMGEKQANDQLVKQGLEYLKQHNDTQRYVFPAVNVKEECERVPSLRGAKYGLREEKCRYSKTVDLNNTVLLDRKVNGIKWSRAKPDNPNGGEIFCFPQGDYQPASNYGLYLCRNAIGIADLSTEKRENYTLINLGEGHDRSKGFLNSPNIFIVGNGFKKYYGGNKDDMFILQGNFIEGDINGGNGVDTVDLEEFASEVRSIRVELGKSGYVSYNGSSFGIKNINRIFTRKDKSDTIICDYNTKYVDGRGGESNDNPDVITIPRNLPFHEMQLIIRPSTNIVNRASAGNFNYTTLFDKGKALVNISLQSLLSGTPTDRHNFFFNCTLSELININIRNISRVPYYNYTIRGAVFSFSSPLSQNKSINEKFNVTISDIPANASYVLSDNTEIKIGKNNLYAIHNTNKTIDEIVKSYPAVADRLRMSLFVNTNNETIVIGHGNHDVISNNFLQRSHLIGSGGENVYVITSGYEILDIENLPIPEVIVYDDFNKKESLKDTLDLRQLVQQVNSDLSIEPISNVIKDENDILIELSISATGLQQDVATVRLKDAFANNWYKELQIILNNVPVKIDDDLDLKPLPLTFNKEIVVVTPQDVEEKDKLIISKEAGQYTFLHSGYDLIITNAFNADIETNKLYTIYFKDFYKESKMETLSIKFTDKEILLSNEMDKINNANSILDITNIKLSDLNKKLLTVAQDCKPNEVGDLVNQGADVNAQDNSKWTPLHRAAFRGCLDVVESLIEKDAKIDIENNINRTALHLAARKCHSSVVQSFVKKGANVNARDKNGKTPLDLASWQKQLDITSSQDCDQTIEHLGKSNQEGGNHVQRKRRHHHGDHNRHQNHLSRKPFAIDSSNQPEIAVSGSTRSSSWINDLFGWVKSSIGGLLSSKPVVISSTKDSISQVDGQFAKASVSNSSSTSTTLSSDGTDKKQESNYFTNGGFSQDNIGYVNANIKQMRERQTPVKFKPSGGNTILEMGDHYLSQVDFNGTIILLDLLIRKVTGQKYISTVDQSISPLEAQGYALNITKGFEKVVEQAGLKSGVSMHRLNIDFVEIQKEITGKIMSGKFDEISGVLNSYLEEACPGREAGCPGKLSPKKFDKFIAQFNKGLLNQSIEQILHNRDGRLEVDGTKQMSLEPQSYLSNASVHSHSKVSTCLSEIGATKLGGNINR